MSTTSEEDAISRNGDGPPPTSLAIDHIKQDRLLQDTVLEVRVQDVVSRNGGDDELVNKAEQGALVSQTSSIVDLRTERSISLSKYGIKTPLDGNHKVPSTRIGRCIACCRAVYWAVLCVVLILVGCPMAAIGTQNSSDWAKYTGLGICIVAFLIALFSPEPRWIITLFPTVESIRGYLTRFKSRFGIKGSGVVDT